MSAPTLTENPYEASLAEQDDVQDVVQDDAASSNKVESPKPGSFLIVSLGFVLLLGGYFVSIFIISDLYQVGFGPNGEAIPSPFAASLETPIQQWMLYGVSALATIAGLIMIGSQRFNPFAAVAYIMCPLVGMTFLVGWPLRAVKADGVAVAVVGIYLATGSCLAAVGIMRLVSLYGEPGGAFGAVGGSIMAQAGLALAFGALLKMWRTRSLEA